jgi:hypothetical protein
VHGFFLADLGNDWSLAGSIMTFAIPVGLFVIVATVLYFLYTRPHTVPGHRDLVPAGGAGGGRHAAGAPRPAAPPAASGPPPAQPPPPTQPPGGGYGGGGAPGGGAPGGGGYGGGGYGRHDGMEGS